jgi:hypothetical protein
MSCGYHAQLTKVQFTGIQIATRSGFGAVLAKARSSEPRRFGNPLAALNVLREVGITAGQFDATGYDPTGKVQEPGNRGRAEAMRNAHRAAAYNEWLSREIAASIEDPRSSILHDDVMAEMDADIAALPAARKRRPAR